MKILRILAILVALISAFFVFPAEPNIASAAHGRCICNESGFETTTENSASCTTFCSRHDGVRSFLPITYGSGMPCSPVSATHGCAPVLQNCPASQICTENGWGACQDIPDQCPAAPDPCSQRTGRPTGCPCTSSNQCIVGATCNAGQCSTPTDPRCTLANNRPLECACSASSQCASGNCTNNICSPAETTGGGGTGENSGLVPCGNPDQPMCTLCHLYDLAKKIIDFLLYGLALPVATISFLFGGILMLTSRGDPKQLQTGKAALSNAVIGLIIAFAAWLLIATLLTTLGFKAPFSKALPWNEFPTCEKAIPLVLDNANSADGYDINDPAVNANLHPQPPDGSSLRTSLGTNCSAAALTPFSSTIASEAAKNGFPASRAGALILKESSGNPNASSPSNAHGLMQLLPSTARNIDRARLGGLSDAEVIRILKSEPNYNIKLGTKHYAALYRKYGSYDLASAAYNGGPGANLPSANCTGLRRWQCLWDNDDHTIPNTGYNETRNYVPWVNNCANTLN